MWNGIIVEVWQKLAFYQVNLLKQKGNHFLYKEFFARGFWELNNCLVWFVTLMENNFKESTSLRWRLYLLTYLVTCLLYGAETLLRNKPVFSHSRNSWISWNPKVHCRIHNSPSHFFILRHLDPIHMPTSQVLNIHLNIILPSTPRSPKWWRPYPEHKGIYRPLL